MKNLTNKLSYLLLLLTVGMFVFTACGDDKPKRVKKVDVTQTTNASDSNAGANVPAEKGGAGFDAVAAELGWETNAETTHYGSPDAKKGGSITLAFDEYPRTLRTEGKDSRSRLITIIGSMVYEPLLSLDAKTLSYTPALATHWKISEDKMTYWFRLDPRAKWSDGKPVVAKDVVATWKLMMDEGIESPSNQGTYGKFNEPVAESDYIVRVECKEESWRNFLYIGTSMTIFPAHYLEKIDGATYLTKYQYQMLPGTGPYTLNSTETKKGELLVLDRRDDYWAANFPSNVGLNNFDQLRFIFILDERLTLEKFKKGDYDLYISNRSQWWVEELSAEKMDAIKTGAVQKIKVFNYKPLGTSGLAFNTLEEPFDNKDVREAFSYLWNIEELNEKLFYNEYVRCQSYYQGSVYENPSNPVNKYNPEKALELLAKAGWKKEAGEKFLKKDGKIFEVDYDIGQSSERVFTPLQKDLEAVGIKLNLVIKTRQAIFDRVMKRKFKMFYANWTGLFFPNPETSMHSKYADQPETNNISGISIPRIDELCAQYDKSYDIDERIKILQEVDKLAVSGFYNAFGWVAPYGMRAAYWNKFDHPEWALTYTGDWAGTIQLWWENPEKAKKVAEFKAGNKDVSIPTHPVKVDYWGKTK